MAPPIAWVPADGLLKLLPMVKVPPVAVTGLVKASSTEPISPKTSAGVAFIIPFWVCGNTRLNSAAPGREDS